MVKTLSAEVKALKQQRATLDASLMEAKAAVRKINSQLNEFKKKRGKRGMVRAKLEAIMKKNGIVRPVYHGGELTGVKVKELLQKIDVIFGKEFKKVLLEVPENERLAKNDEVNKMVDMYRDLGFLMDGVFATARIKNGELTEDDIDFMRRLTNATAKMWRNLRLSFEKPKIHGVEVHILQQMVLWNGIGCFVEDFVEKAHQDGVRDEVRTKGLSRIMAYNSHSNWEWNKNTNEVVNEKKEMKEKTSKGGKKKSTEEKEEAKRKKRIDNRKKSLERVESGMYQMVEDYKRQL